MKIFDFLRGREARLELLCKSVARTAFLSVIVLVPLAYLPWTTEALEINKQTVLVVCASICTLALIGYFSAKKELVFKKSLVYWILFAFFIIALLSCIFSLAPYLSFLGATGQEYTSLITLISLMAIFFTGINVIEEKHIPSLIKSILIPSAFILLINVFSLLGWQLFDQNFLGAPNSLGIFACIVFAMALSSINYPKYLQRDLFAGFIGLFTRISSYLVLISTLFILYALDYWLLWAFIVMIIFTLLISSMAHKIENIVGKRLLALIIVLILSIIFIFVSTPGSISTPPEVAPTSSTSWDIAQSTLSNTSQLFGSGPGTYELDFQKYKPSVMNASVLWDTTFNRSSSHILTMLTTMGWLGAIIYALFVVFVLYFGLRLLIGSKNDQYILKLSIFLPWLCTAVTMFFYSYNMTLQTFFWALAAVLMSISIHENYSFNLKKSQSSQVIATFFGALLVLIMLFAGFVIITRYMADIAFARAITNSQSGKSIDEVIGDMVLATSLNKWDDSYARNLSYALLYKSGELLSDPSVNPEVVIGFIGQSSEYAKKAVELSPNSVVNYAMLGDVYREITPFITGSDEFAISAYKVATELAPTNPKYFTSLGRAYLAKADSLGVVIAGDDTSLAQDAKILRDEALINAIDAMNYALSLKNDYAPAQYYLALAYERQGNLSEAIARIQSLLAQSPYDANLALQLGFLYLQQGKLDEAKIALEYVISLSSDYSNARWFLSSVLEQQGNIQGAIEQVEKVLELNPDNGLIKERLETLKAGLVAEEELEPIEE